MTLWRLVLMGVMLPRHDEVAAGLKERRTRKSDVQEQECSMTRGGLYVADL